MKRALLLMEKALGPDHDNVGVAINNIAVLHQNHGRHAEAEALYKRALAIFEKAQGADHPLVTSTLNNLAEHYFAVRDWAHAVEFWRRGTGVIVERMQRGTQLAGQALTGKQKSEAEQLSAQFGGLVKALSRLAPEGRPANPEVTREMFQTAQWALGSDAALSLTQMAARGAKGNPNLAALVRERQDLIAEWQARDAARSAAVAQSPETRDARAEAENMARLGAVDRRVAEIDKRLAVEFPDYASLASPAPLSIEETQALLGQDEALVLMLDTDGQFKPIPEESFIWIATKTELRLVRSDLGTAALTREVQGLRCGLDAAAATGLRCAELTGQRYTEADYASGKPLPFDHGRAHTLYKALFSQVEDLIKGKHLLIVPSGPLTQLPFQVLVTRAPKNADHRSAAWLVRDHALTVLPAVSSLKALRRVARPSGATQPMIGFGNPLLSGPDGRYAKSAQLARDNQLCRNPNVQNVATYVSARGNTTPIATRGGLANISVIRMQAPLPETADELCAVARDLGADPAEMRLGARATEREVKTLSESGRLAHYRVLHFATHGALAGELNGTAEPGLILTPPVEASAEDDGYLSASEIAGLKLDADWVILSACNTAAGDASGAQALSGLARTFFYAQARALLVSHWAVDSDATVKLITATMAEVTRDRSTGRAEALRRAILALIDKGKAREAHPAYWAPFVVVGEGAR